jgi:hypothetical protein
VAFIIPTIERPQQMPAVQPAGTAAPKIDLAPLADADFPEEPAAASDLEGLDVGELDTGELGAAAIGETLLHIPCPNGHELEVPLDMLGQRALCPQCNVEFRLRREKSVEYIRQQEVLDRRRADFWFRLAIIAACVVGVVLVIMFAAITLS